MSYLGEKVAYLKGLAEGMKIDEATNEGKMIKAIIEVLGDFADTVNDIEDDQDSLGDQLEALDDDVADLEEELFGEPETIGEFECPYCKEKIELSEDMIDNEEGTIECPNCHKKIDVEWDCDCDDCNHDEE